MEQLTSAGSDYLLEIGLESLHKDSKVWKSRIEMWKRELVFFQRLLDSYSNKFENPEDKKAEDHFQNLIIYYNGELLDEYKQAGYHTVTFDASHLPSGIYFYRLRAEDQEESRRILLLK